MTRGKRRRQNKQYKKSLAKEMEGKNFIQCHEILVRDLVLKDTDRITNNIIKHLALKTPWMEALP